jgi:hypothetical protein
MVIDAGKNVSTAYVMDMKDSLVIGDKVTTILDQ